MITQTGKHFSENPIVTFWSPKGGSGTSVAAAVFALACAQRTDTVLIDAAGDQSSIFGVPSTGVGFLDWLSGAPGASGEALSRLGVEVSSGLRLVTSGTQIAVSQLASLDQVRRAFPSSVVVIDAGRIPGEGDVRSSLAIDADQSLVVLRPCYLAAQRALKSEVKATGIVFVDEPGRVLRAKDIAAVLNVEVVANVELDPALARLVDAGRMTKRLPRSTRALERLVDRFVVTEIRHVS